MIQYHLDFVDEMCECFDVDNISPHLIVTLV